MESAPTVCYRHPDRVTRLSCSDCGRNICAECSRDAAVGQKCPECGGPGQRTRVITARSFSHADRRTTPLTLALIGIAVGVFVLGYVLPDFDTAEIRRRFSQQVGTPLESEWWRGITAMFLHGSAMHLAFNMWALWLFGPSLERRFGTVPFGALYLAAGLNGAALFAGVNPGPAAAVGASGAIFGLFGALLLNAYRQRHTRAGRAIFNQLIMLLGINLMLPFLVPNIAWEAHIGGLIAGFVIAFAWDRLPSHGPYLLLQRTIIALMVAATALTILILV